MRFFCSAAAHRNPQPEFLVSARAREFSVPFVCANKAGRETETVAFCGRSMVVRGDGTILAEAPAKDETLSPPHSSKLGMISTSYDNAELCGAAGQISAADSPLKNIPRGRAQPPSWCV